MLAYSNSWFYSHCISWIKQQYPLLEIVFFSAIYMGTVPSTWGLFSSSSFSRPQTRKARVMQNRKFGGGVCLFETQILGSVGKSHLWTQLHCV